MITLVGKTNFTPLIIKQNFYYTSKLSYFFPSNQVSFCLLFSIRSATRAKCSSSENLFGLFIKRSILHITIGRTMIIEIKMNAFFFIQQLLMHKTQLKYISMYFVYQIVLHGFFKLFKYGYIFIIYNIL